MPVLVIVPAAGSGSRFGGDIPKQFLALAGKPILQHVVERFVVDAEVSRIIVPIAEALVTSVKPMPRVQFVAGGATRQQSVSRGLEAALEDDGDVVAVHDSVRPFFSPEVFHAAVAAAREHGAAFPALPVSDTIHVVDGDRVVMTPDRRFLVGAQTPQCFRVDVLREVLARAAREGDDASDEAGLAAKYGFDVRAVPGDSLNFKITRPEDLAMAERVIAEWGNSFKLILSGGGGLGGSEGSKHGIAGGCPSRLMSIRKLPDMPRFDPSLPPNRRPRSG